MKYLEGFIIGGMYICFWGILDLMCYDYKQFIDIVNSNGEVRREYLKLNDVIREK